MSRVTLPLNCKANRERAAYLAMNVGHGSIVEFKAPRRSLDQNALMWSRLYEVSRQVEWYGQKLSAEDWKDVFTASLRKARVVPGIDPGSYVPLGMRTSDMTKEEMTNLLDLIGAFGAEHGVTFQDSDPTEGLV